MRLLKLAVFVGAVTPAIYLLLATLQIANLSLGPNGVETLLHSAGLWGLRFLLLTLFITPLRRITGLNWLVRLRRMLGLFAFFYLFCHLLVYLVLDQHVSAAAIIEDVVERPYITIGLSGFLLLVPLALTSTDAMIRRLGRRWVQLHRLIYPAAILGVWHFWWQVKQDIREPLLYAAILALLLGFRVWHWRSRFRRRQIA